MVRSTTASTLSSCAGWGRRAGVAEELLAALDAAHDDFIDALDDVDADLVTVPGVMED